MTPKMERILVALSFVLVFEAIVTELAGILLLKLVDTIDCVSVLQRNGGGRPGATYRNSSSVSNFLGFLGQHSQM